MCDGKDIGRDLSSVPRPSACSRDHNPPFSPLSPTMINTYTCAEMTHTYAFTQGGECVYTKWQTRLHKAANAFTRVGERVYTRRQTCSCYTLHLSGVVHTHVHMCRNIPMTHTDTYTRKVHETLILIHIYVYLIQPLSHGQQSLRWRLLHSLHDFLHKPCLSPPSLSQQNCVAAPTTSTSEKDCMCELYLCTRAFACSITTDNVRHTCIYCCKLHELQT